MISYWLSVRTAWTKSPSVSAVCGAKANSARQKKVAAARPDTELHVVLDNYGTHKHPEVRNWLAEPANQRITLHFTPTSCS
jgi:DDE superfamily endonuclease